MGHPSTPQFRTLHALRIKGFATVDTIADMTQVPTVTVTQHLEWLARDGHAQFRENRGLWQLTPPGRDHHLTHLAVDTSSVLPNPTLDTAYEEFLEINSLFKELCGAWQLIDGEPNDHGNAGYDAAVIENLSHLHVRAEPVVATIGSIFDRMAVYGPRLESVLVRIHGGESNMFTGVMCGSYHDVWMELHEDLILTQGIDRTAEGSF